MTVNLYDAIPYTKHIYQQTQPNHLATLATLFGMQPPPVANCRVLELGCASGINTMAMAQAIPKGEFVGIDFSEQQINEGQHNLYRLAFPNVTLKHKDILDIVPSDLGQFDYIVAHGVYSWVSPAVREKLFQICHHCLQPNGVVYISYNVYPGWHVDRMLREMMLYRTQNIVEPHEKLKQAKILLQFFQESIKQKFDSYSLLLRNELHRVSQLNENYLVHEYLEEHNKPVLFHEFLEHAQQHHLQYLTDMKTPFVAVDNFLSEQAGTLDFSLIEKEQYMDFLRNTPFRETLLCHQAISLNRNLPTDALNDLYIAGPLKSTAQIPALNEAPETLKTEIPQRFENLAGEAVFSVSSPLLKAVCLYLGEIWPQSLSFNHLIQQVSKLLRMVEQERTKSEEKRKPETERDQNVLLPAEIEEVKTMLLEFYLKNIVELSVYPPRFTLFISEYPIASPIARLQSEQSKQITNLRYEVFALNLATRLVLRHLDGTHNKLMLQTMLRSNIETGDLILAENEEKKGLTEIEPEILQNYLSEQVTAILQNLAKKAYLLA
jgi:methyltransferase-like protein/predicted O-methyltransferase YrrM